VLGELARWGYDWAWGTPRPLEAVDIGAIFRLLPGLLASGASVSGRVDLIVVDGREGDETTVYSFTVAGDGVQLAEHGSGDPRVGAADATLRGSASAWIRALAPRPETDGLQFSGSQELTSLVLETLSPADFRADEAPVESAAS
jgi:hypothetical protein